MKKSLLISLLAAMLLGFNVPSQARDREHTLKIYNWADYIDEDLLVEFPVWYKEQTGEDVEIIYDMFDINENMLTKIEKGQEDYDVVCPSEYIIERMLQTGLLLPIDKNFGQTPDYTGNVAPFVVESFNKMSDEVCVTDYAVGFMWGTTGILYNPTFVSDEEVRSWSFLWNDKFANRILMKDAYRDVYSALIQYCLKDDIAAGTVTRDELMNDITDERVQMLEDTLKAAKKNILGWEVDLGKEAMTKGKTWMNVSWSGDAMWAMEEATEVGVELRYTVPEEGSNVWFDGWVIPKYARNVKAASYFINYMCMPENALRNMDAIGYVSVIGTPEILAAKIDSTITTYSNLNYFFGEGADSVPVNNVQYPDSSVIARCAMMRDAGKDTQKMLEMWSHVKGDNLNSSTIIIIGVVLAAIIIYAVAKKSAKSKQGRKGKKSTKRK